MITKRRRLKRCCEDVQCEDSFVQCRHPGGYGPGRLYCRRHAPKQELMKSRFKNRTEAEKL